MSGRMVPLRIFMPIKSYMQYMYGNDGDNKRRLALEEKKYRGEDLSKEYKDNQLQMEMVMDEAESYLAHHDAFAKYLGYPQKNNMVVESKYKPSVGSKDDEYYRFNFQGPYYWMPKVEEYLTSNEAQDNKKKVLNDLTLNDFTMQGGMDDDNRHYVSIYDIWDYNYIPWGTGDNVAELVGGKPFEIYDRVYLDDWHGVPNTEGYFLPTVTINGSGRKTTRSRMRDGGPINSVDYVNNSDAEFAKRLRERDTTSIPTWDSPGYMSTYRMASVDDIAYPMVQKVDGRLVDYTRSPYLPSYGLEKAMQTGNYIRFANEHDADDFARSYKALYPQR